MTMAESWEDPDSLLPGRIREEGGAPVVHLRRGSCPAADAGIEQRGFQKMIAVFTQKNRPRTPPGNTPRPAVRSRQEDHPEPVYSLGTPREIETTQRRSEEKRKRKGVTPVPMREKLDLDAGLGASPGGRQSWGGGWC